MEFLHRHIAPGLVNRCSQLQKAQFLLQQERRSDCLGRYTESWIANQPLRLKQNGGETLIKDPGERRKRRHERVAKQHGCQLPDPRKVAHGTENHCF